ncbi:protection of telomeres protein 1b-like [Nicotiana tabacum]|uniref:Protection of telomeres protein 1 n=2 Tax=Nicotiana TaxID=4085 RepID=A0A1S3Z3G1_TOBAC|nr:PREDICTED: protection of telomeres protein 1b-like isoform X1 [Nicotiana sylvestris]XP_016458717.1 PREDICTED: protection of telomeres protein 1b-like [Nicotiana tabacum]
MGRRSSRDDYKFLQIVDARAALNQKVNLIGVVIETGLPKQSKGTDCFCTIKIIDESYPSPGISVNFFAATMDKLPQVLTFGDIIQLSQVVMKTHGPEIYALFNKKFSSFAIFDRKDNSSFLPYQCSLKYHAREQDKKFILGLMKWLDDHQIDTGLTDLHSLKEIREGEHFNLICKILHICEVEKDKWMLLVWDGTDTPPVTIKTKLEEELENPLPLQSVNSPLPRDILCTLPPLGTVLRVTIDRCNEKLGVNFLKSNRWLKLINIRCELHTALWHVVLMPFTKLSYLSDEDDIVLQRMRDHDERRKSKWGWMPLSCFPWPSDITETDFPNVPFVSLMRVLVNPKVVGKFHCVVRVVAAFPWIVEDFRSPSGVYRIRLTLEDPTARIHAYLYAEDAEQFFDGYPSVYALTKKRNLLLGTSEGDDGSEMNDYSRNPPWIKCCLKSYHIDDSDVWGSRNFRIFATTLKV